MNSDPTTLLLEPVAASRSGTALVPSHATSEPATSVSPRRELRVDRGPAPGARTRGPDYYPGLDILRGVAAVTVVVFHAIEYFDWKSFPSSNPLALWFRAGWVGVDLFFVISGVVITLSALGLWERGRDVYAREFLTRRFSRIIPLHYLTCLFYVLFIVPAMVRQPFFWWHVVTHLTFTHGFSPIAIGSINAANWSLAVEMQFYLLVLFSAPFLGRLRPWQVVVGAIGVRWIYRIGVDVLVHGRMTPEGVNLTWFGAAQLPGMLDYFGFGMALAMVFHGDKDGRFRAFLHKTRWLWPVATAATGCLVVGIHRPESALWNSLKLVVVWRTLLGATCLLAVASACAINDRWFLWLTRPLRYLGTISYGIYLWHMLVVMSFKSVFVGEPLRAFTWTMATTLLLASLSWHFFEQPTMARFRKAS